MFLFQLLLANLSSRRTLDIGLNSLRLLSILIKPVIPSIVAKIESFLNIDSLTWPDLETQLEGHTINRYEHIAQRLTPEEVSVLTHLPVST